MMEVFMLMCVCRCDVFCFDLFFCFKQKPAYEMRISDWSSDVCSSDLVERRGGGVLQQGIDMRSLFFGHGGATGKRQRIGTPILGDSPHSRKRGGADCHARAARSTLETRLFPLLPCAWRAAAHRSEEHTSELQSLMRISYAVFCLKKKK